MPVDSMGRETPLGIVGTIEREYAGSKLEMEIFDWWEKNNIYFKVKKLRSNGAKFYFLDGPPYVTNPIHVGTAWNKVLKDAFLRYFRMKGFNVRDQPGYDMHGLPIEVMVEKKLGLKSKRDIELHGVEAFVNECKKYALEHLNIMEAQFKNLGVWMDWKKPYMTIEDDYIQSEWWLIKRAYELGLLSEGYRVFHWCPRCQTVLSGYEVTDAYKMVRDPSIYVKFPVEGRKHEYILIWTTTPWTLPANVAIMVHPDETYLKVRVGGECYILAKARCEAVFKEIGLDYEVVESFPGKMLEGLKYVPPLKEEVPLQRRLKNAHFVVLSEEYVSMDEGTGCVHSAPGHGEEDFLVGLKYNLPVVSPVDNGGRFTSEAGKYSGLMVWEANEKIISDLKRKGYLLYRTWIEHRYPHCWRCKSPLILRSTHQWFIRVSEIKDKLIEENYKVEWFPKWAGMNRFYNWLINIRDWVISRQRYWGTPLPIWICERCGRKVIIGSVKELKEKALNPSAIIDLHRPWIDNVKLKCECGGIMRRVPDVLDVWMDSSVSSWACLKYPMRNDEFKKWWPADFILEGPDQTRGWFYTLLVSGFICFGFSPYRRVLMHGWALDEKGRPMHKSLGNVIAPEDVFKKYSRDAFRWYELQCTPWEDLKFSMKGVGEIFKVLKIMWNVYYFASLYMNLDGFSPEKYTLSNLKDHLQPEDKWLLSKCQSLIIKVNDAMEKFQIHVLARSLKDFIVEDVSRWYIKLIRRRTWIESEDPSKYAAYACLYNVLLTLLKLAAPIIPFITEKLYQSIFRPADEDLPESVHMLDWPKPSSSFIYKDYVPLMDVARSIVEASYSARQMKQLKLRYPLKSMIIVSDDSRVRRAVEIFGEIIRDQSNVKELSIISPEEDKFKTYKIVPVYSALGPKYGNLTSRLIESLKSLDASKVKRSLEEKGFFKFRLDGKEIELTWHDVSFEEKVVEGYSMVEFNLGRIYLDCHLYDELVAEGLAREVVRRLQEMRKEIDLSVEAYINAYVSVSNDDILSKLKMMKWYILREVRVKELLLTKLPPYKASYEKLWKVEGLEFRMGITPL
ncbi:MAG: isoleucine--tRNA ligase [Candidatus Verstraetearchaeota archaeon]|nr:isoleucine--tRNA ligase [Candidatus Verstraetearchaeota archaeon]